MYVCAACITVCVSEITKCIPMLRPHCSIFSNISYTVPYSLCVCVCVCVCVCCGGADELAEEVETAGQSEERQEEQELPAVGGRIQSEDSHTTFCLCYVQSQDLGHPQMALCKPQIPPLHRNPKIAQTYFHALTALQKALVSIPILIFYLQNRDNQPLYIRTRHKLIGLIVSLF